MPRSPKARTLSAEALQDAYMDVVLEEGREPSSFHELAKRLQASESDLYAHAGSLNGLRQQIWQRFFDESQRMLEASSNFREGSKREKLLSMLYTMFELLAQNRSYVLISLKQHQVPLDRLSDLRLLRRRWQGFAESLTPEYRVPECSRLEPCMNRGFREGIWLEFLFLLSFWMRDDSPGFEHTDQAIEKSVRALYDLVEQTPIESLLDFGKFMYHQTREHL